VGDAAHVLEEETRRVDRVDVRLRRAVDEQRESRGREDVGLELDAGGRHEGIVARADAACHTRRRERRARPTRPGRRPEASAGPIATGIRALSAVRSWVIPEIPRKVKIRLDMACRAAYS
jgi:hypothetical protein